MNMTLLVVVGLLPKESPINQVLLVLQDNTHHKLLGDAYGDLVGLGANA